MRRRDFSASLVIASAAIQPLLAQVPEKLRTIAIVASFGKTETISETGSGFWRAFFGELRRLGGAFVFVNTQVSNLAEELYAI
jgi:hypothetical protein